MKYRNLENIQHPQPKFTWSETSSVQTYCDLFFGKPPPEEAFYNTQVVLFEDHQLQVKGHENNEESSRKAKEDIEFRKGCFKPADLSNQEKKSDAGRKEGRSRQEAGKSEGEESTGKG